ncbi:MAG: WG repeat-containing protein [Clostridia bacterium]|nr:WG repeat-containing protein [Clostridia bacterium]
MDKNGRYGLIDTQGNYLLECEYDDIIYDKSDIFLVCKDNVWQLATLKNGEVSLEALVKSDVINPIKDSTMQNIIASDGDYYGMISSENKLLVEFKYEYIYDLTGGLYAGVNGNATDLISSDGSVTATLDALVLGEYSEGKIPCYANGKFFYVNRDGKTVLEVSVPDAMSIDSFYEGIAVIQLKDGSYSYLTENGDFATRAIWDYAARFARGYALVMDIDTSGVEAVRSWKIIDHNFNTVERLNVEVYVNEMEEHTTDFSNGFIRTVDNETGKMGFAYTDNTFAAHDCRSDGHIYGAWFVAKAPEVGVAGEKYVACVKCGEIMETELMDPLPTPDPEESETTESSGTSTSESTNTSSTSTSESTNTSSTSTSESTNTSSTSTSESTNTSSTSTSESTNTSSTSTSESTNTSSTSTSESTNTSSTSTSESTNTSSTSTSESTNTSSTSTSESTNTSATETTKKDEPKDPDDEDKSGFMKFIDTLASIFGISSTTFMVIAGSVIAVVVIGVIGFIKFYYF